jgi:hypothetical protein
VDVRTPMEEFISSGAESSRPATTELVNKT